MKSFAVQPLAFLIFLCGCSQQTLKPDSEITEDWFKAPYQDARTEVSSEEAGVFLDQFFDLMDQVMFDPKYRLDDVNRIKTELMTEASKSFFSTKGDLVKALNQKFKEIHFSHLAALDPEKSLKIMKMIGGQKDEKPEPAVSARTRGDVGIIKISSFLVPSITLNQVTEARRKVKDAKYLVYDMRNNGGGSVSSNSYVIETIIGPGKTIQFSRNRAGIVMNSAVVKEGYFPDESNFGSEADIDFENRNKFVEWRTRKEAVKDNRPTIIVVNSHCGSSCDIFTAAIREHKAARIVGAKTAGAVLGAIAFKLNWKAYTAIMPVSQIISPKGNLYEGVGIMPEVVIGSCEDPMDEKCIDEGVRLFTEK